MEERYAVLLNGRKIATVSLDPKRRGTLTARLAPLPGFKSIAHHRRVLQAARVRLSDDGELPTADRAEAEGAAAVLKALELELINDESLMPVATRRLRILRDDPPRLRVTW